MPLVSLAANLKHTTVKSLIAAVEQRVDVTLKQPI
jgi:hypothetical protein